MIKEITSTQNQLIKDLVSLKSLSTSKKKKENRFLIEGEDLVFLAYSQGLLDLIITTKVNQEYSDIEQIIVPEFIISKLSNQVSCSSIIGVAHYKLNHELGNKLIYLDGVQDPGNVGTIIRTALSFSYSGVILSSDSSSIYNEKVIQSSKGGVFKLPIFDTVSLEELKEKGYQIVSTTLQDAINYKEVKLKEKFVLVFGNEGQGIKEKTKCISDDLIKIEMDNIDSLNVAIAAGILMNYYRY